MLQRKFFIFCLFLSLICNIPYSHAQKGKEEFGFAYGYLSSFTLLQGVPFNASTGTAMFNCKYYINDAVTAGLIFGYENNSNTGSYLTFAPEFTFRYLDTRDYRIRVRLYGGVSYGLTVFDDWQTGYGHSDRTGPKLWGFHGTPFGIRVGRKLAAFAEIGFGYKGLINGGISYRFKM